MRGNRGVAIVAIWEGDNEEVGGSKEEGGEEVVKSPREKRFLLLFISLSTVLQEATGGHRYPRPFQ